MVKKRKIFGGEELMKFFSSFIYINPSNKDLKAFYKYFIMSIKDNWYWNHFVYTTYKDMQILLRDLLDPNMKWNVTFDYPWEAGCEVLHFETDKNCIEFSGVDYNDVKDFFKTKK